jgi:alpha-tubulin suppressor-like RCC1 family protein
MRPTAAVAACLLLAMSACVDLPTDPIVFRAVLHPVRAAAPLTFSDISAGHLHTCGLTFDGTAYCWGANESYRLGVSTSFPTCQIFPCTATPQQAGGTTRFKQIIAGTDKTCALAIDGKPWCWGSIYRWFDTLQVSATAVPVATDSVFVSISGGGAHHCGLTAGGTAMCWGVNTFGSLGDSTKTNRHSPVVVAGNHRFTSLAAGGIIGCGVDTNGDAWCWGDNRFGQLGLGEVPYNSYGLVRTYPGRVVGGHKFTSIVVGGDHVCALDTTGAAWCWGLNANAQQLGDDSGIVQRGVPGAVVGGLKFDALSASIVMTCGHTPANEMYCWGSDYFGGLGDGREVNGGVGHPVRSAGGPYARVAAGTSHACGLKADGVAWCWGDGLYGQLGDR